MDIHDASQNGNKNRVKILLETGEDPNKRKGYGLTPLHIACQNEHLDIIKLLLENGAQIDATDDVGRTSLFKASFNGSLQVVKLLLKNKALVNEANKDGTTPLMAASWYGHLDVVIHLLENKALVNHADKDGDTALISASQNGHLQVISLLLDKGADIHAINNAGHNALQEALACYKEEITNLFFEHEIKQHRGSTASEHEEGITKVRESVVKLNEEVSRLKAELKSIAKEKDNSDKERIEEIDKLKLERSELFVRLNSSQTTETNSSRNDKAKFRAEERTMAQLTETLMKRNQRITSLLDEKEKFDEEKEFEIKKLKDRLETVISERDAEIARLNCIIQDLENQVQDLTSSNHELGERNEQLVALVRKRDIEIERLSELISHLKIEFTNVYAPVQLLNINIGAEAGKTDINVC